MATRYTTVLFLKIDASLFPVRARGSRVAAGIGLTSGVDHPFLCAVDAPTVQAFGGQHGINAYPTFHVYRNGARQAVIRGANVAKIEEVRSRMHFLPRT